MLIVFGNCDHVIHLGDVAANSNKVFAESYHNTKQVIEKIGSLVPVVVEGVAGIRC